MQIVAYILYIEYVALQLVTKLCMFDVYRLGQKSDTLFNHINIMPYKLQKLDIHNVWTILTFSC